MRPHGGAQEVHQQSDGGGLAGTVWAEKPEHHSGRNDQIDIDDPARGPVGLGELLGLYGSNHTSMLFPQQPTHQRTKSSVTGPRPLHAQYEAWRL